MSTLKRAEVAVPLEFDAGVGLRPTLEELLRAGGALIAREGLQPRVAARRLLHEAEIAPGLAAELQVLGLGGLLGHGLVDERRGKGSRLHAVAQGQPLGLIFEGADGRMKPLSAFTGADVALLFARAVADVNGAMKRKRVVARMGFLLTKHHADRLGALPEPIQRGLNAEVLEAWSE